MAETGTVETPPAETPPVAETPEWQNGEDFTELLADESNKNILSFYKTSHEGAKALVEKEKLLRSNFRLPKKLSDEQITELSGRLAEVNKVPKNAEGYTLQRPEEINESFDITEEAKMAFRAYAKERSIAPETLQGFYEKYLQLSSGAQDTKNSEFAEASKTRNTETVKQLKTYWGPVEYEARVDLIEEYAKSRSLDENEYKEFQAELESTGMKNSPILFKMMGDAAKWYSIMEKNSTISLGQFQTAKGNKTISAETKRATMYPKTPKSLGGGAPG